MKNRMNFQWDDHDGGLGDGHKPTRLDRLRVWLDPETWDIALMLFRLRIKRLWSRLLGTKGNS